MAKTMDVAHACVKWLHFTPAVIGAALAMLGILAWADANFDDKASAKDLDEVEAEMTQLATKEDVKEVKDIIVRCLIEKRCD